MKPSYIVQWPGESRFLVYTQKAPFSWVNSAGRAEHFMTQAAAIRAIAEVQASPEWFGDPLAVLEVYGK